MQAKLMQNNQTPPAIPKQGPPGVPYLCSNKSDQVCTLSQEPLGVLRATLEAVLDATMPAGCTRTVYLCDDGADPEKQTFVAGVAHLGVR
jgi:hypothetical protein